MDGISLTQDLISIASETINRPAETYLTDDYLTHSFFSQDLVVATWIPAVPLVHKKSDLDKSGNGDSEKDEDNDDSNGKSEKSDENAASTTAPRQGTTKRDS
ncbi:hypothetical protein NW762_007960 [Fusarium torreyae]|uniref:Uncharacterized protein n=1 Tax=Fusarium torreyae TaxID=1237075 RepID=A0A9W8RYB5_9HYPO|nr:hypothetical protein NW762_007960 [Fusarium torreyae]